MGEFEGIVDADVEGFGPGRFKETGVHDLLRYSQYNMLAPSTFPQGAQSLYPGSTVYAVLGLFLCGQIPPTYR